MNENMASLIKPCACPVCKAEDVSFLFQVDGFDIWHCVQCSASFVRDMPSEDELKAFYDKSDWFENGLKGGYQTYDQQTEGTIPFVEHLLASLDSGKPYKSILDIGCGYGTHLGLAHQLGWECFGVEISDHARQIAVERHGDYAFIKSDVAELIPHEFDLVLMLDVIEHLPDPYVLFYTLFAKGAIRKDTTIIITTPNAQSMDAISKKEAWEYMHPPSHLVYYSAESMVQFFHRLKFKTIEISGQYQTEAQFKPGDATAFKRNDEIAGNSGLIVKASGSDFTQFMQERYVTGTWSVLAEYEHMPRYAWAKSYCAGKKILDFGCGTGYGSKILAQVAAQVTALDIDQEALEWALSMHKVENLTFIRSEVLGEELAANSFDVIVNFEMIEHVDQALQKKCLEQFARLLKEDGFLLISTPNPDVTAEYGENPYHIHEMTKVEFEVFLRDSFKNINVLEQFINPVVSIKDNLVPTKPFSVGEARAVAYIGVASNNPITDVGGIEYIDCNFDFVGEALRDSAVLNKARYGEYQHFLDSVQLHSELKDKKKEFSRLEGELAELREALTAKEKMMNKTAGELRRCKDELRNCSEGLHDIRLSRSYRFMNSLANDPFGLRKILKVTYLAVAILVPEPIKALVRPLKSIIKGKRNYSVSLIPSDNRKPKVLHLIANFMLGGSSRLIADIVQSLDNYHHEVVTSAAPDVPVYPEIPVYVFPMGFDPVILTKLLDEYSADIFHIHYWGDSDEPWYHAVYQLIKHRDCKIIENINTPVAPYIGDAIDRYVYVSDYVKDAFGQEDGKSSTVHPGSDFKLFNRDKFEDVVDDCIGMVYRLENDKLNLDSIQPFIEVVKKRSQTKVIIVGGGSNLGAYQNICKQQGVLDAFTFTGYVKYETLPEWYRQLSIFVAPVWKESFGQVASFAMSMGLPVVGYDIGAISEIIGKPEFLAEPGNSEQLADIIIDLLNDRAQRLEIGRHNQKRVHSKFSLEAMTSSYQEIYDQLLKEKQ